MADNRGGLTASRNQMAYQILDDDETALDAHCDIGDAYLVLHSRGGTIGKKNVRNTEYVGGLKMLLDRIFASNLPLERIYVDSSTVQNIPIDKRTVFDLDDLEEPLSEVLESISSKMKTIGRQPKAKGAGNATKRLRFDFGKGISKSAIFSAVGVRLVSRDFRGADRLPTNLLNRVTTENIVDAVNFLRGGLEFEEYGPSTDYDVALDEGLRLPPKAVFGLAASEALGFRVLPRHFSGGEGTPCFNSIRSAGYEIVHKEGGGKSTAKQTEPFQPTKERTVSRIVKTVNDTVRASGGQDIARSSKFKRLVLTDEDLSEHINNLYDRQQGKCALTGVMMRLDGEVKDSQLWWSLDRIDSNGDYELGNLQLVCRFANFWKSDQQNSEFLRLMELVKETK
jgi:hypothetical protein